MKSAFDLRSVETPVVAAGSQLKLPNVVMMGVIQMATS